MKPPHKIPNIYIVGAQSTGKTTLVNALKAAFTAQRQQQQQRQQNDSRLSQPPPPSPVIIQEVARGVLSKRAFTAEDIKHNPSRALQLQRLILAAQWEEEQAASSPAVNERVEGEEGSQGERKGESNWFISDRSGIDPIVYARRYVSEAGAAELLKSQAWTEMRERMRSGAVVVVCEAGADWVLVDDGVRLMPEGRGAWMEFDRLFRGTLEEEGIGCEVLDCAVRDVRARVEFVVERWEALRRRLVRDDVLASAHSLRESTLNDEKVT